MRRDSIFYKIFQRSPSLLFDLLPEAPADAADYRFDSVEVKETSFRIDGVFLPPDASGVVYFAEVQFQKDPLLYERLTSEATLHFYRHRDQCADWRLVAIYPTADCEQDDVAPHQYLLDTGKLTRIYLDQLGELATLPLGLALMVLTILEGQAAQTAARQLVQRAQNERAIIEMISTIMVYKFTNLSRDEVAAMLGIELEKTPIYREIFAEGEQKGEAKLLLIMLGQKLGELPQTLIARISQLSVAQLEQFSECIFELDTVGDLEVWLSEHELSE